MKLDEKLLDLLFYKANTKKFEINAKELEKESNFTLSNNIEN